MTTIEKKVVPVRMTGVVQPGTTRILRGEGMPFAKDPSRRGNLIVEFDIVFPERMNLSESERKIFEKHLPKLVSR